MKNKLEEAGKRQLIWLSNDLFEITEDVRINLGMSRSGFYRYAVTRLLQDLNVLSKKAKQSSNRIEEEPPIEPVSIMDPNFMSGGRSRSTRREKRREEDYDDSDQGSVFSRERF